VNEATAATAAAIDRAIVAVPYYGFLGLRAAVIDHHVMVVLPGADRHVGDAVRRSVHGGVLAAFLEAAAQLRLHVLDSRRSVMSVDFTSAFLREAATTDTFASPQLVRVGRRFAHVRVDAWQTDPAHPVAVGNGTFSFG